VNLKYTLWEGNSVWIPEIYLFLLKPPQENCRLQEALERWPTTSIRTWGRFGAALFPGARVDIGHHVFAAASWPSGRRHTASCRAGPAFATGWVWIRATLGQSPSLCSAELAAVDRLCSRRQRYRLRQPQSLVARGHHLAPRSGLSWLHLPVNLVSGQLPPESPWTAAQADSSPRQFEEVARAPRRLLQMD
jgi:hypothetical protein